MWIKQFSNFCGYTLNKYISISGWLSIKGKIKTTKCWAQRQTVFGFAWLWVEVILQRFFGRYVSLLSDIPKILKAPCSQIMSFKVHRRLKKNIMKYELKWMYRIQLPSPLSRERTSLIGVPALQFGGALRLVAHLIFFRGVRND